MKIISLKEASELINDGDIVALGGNTINRAPMSMVCEIIRSGKKDLRIVKTAGGMDVDMLCLAGVVQSVDAGFVSYETELGLAVHYRRAVESGKVIANEHACYTVIQALRAAAYGIPFMPVKGLVNSQLLDEYSYFDIMESPFDGERVAVVKAINPDVGIISVSCCDKQGNASIDGALYDDALISRACKKVIVIAEKISAGSAAASPKDVVIPGFMVDAVVECHGGSWPCAHHGHYAVDERAVKELISLKSNDDLPAYIERLSQGARALVRRGWL